MKLTGFTLFYNPTKKRWQMSVRAEDGWNVNHVPEEQAQAIFRLLESTDYPYGVWTVRAPVEGPLTIEEGFKQLTEALRGLARPGEGP